MAGNLYFNKEEKTVPIRTKRLLTLAIAAVLMLSLSIMAYAAYNAISSPQAAEKVALEQLEKWKELGLLSPEVTANGPAAKILESEERTGSEYWYGRLFTHSYEVRFYGGEGNKYSLSLTVDTLSGKLKVVNIEAAADESDLPVSEFTEEMPVDPMDPEGERQTVTYYFYENFDDIIPADMTVDRFCALLADYWGFSGYRLADTEDSFYQAHWSAVNGESLLKDMPTENYYLTVFFDGDQEGAPMYLQLDKFPGRVCFALGTRHLVG